MSGLVFSVRDEAGPFLQAMLLTRQDWQRKALKSAGWFGQQQIKKGIRSGAPGGKKYAAGIGAVNRKKLEGKSGRFPALGKMANPIVYTYTNGRVEFGWQSLSAVHLGSKLEKGSTIVVTPKMRRKFFAAGLFIGKNTTTITNPSRPTYDPMVAFLMPKFAPYMEEKILEYMDKEIRVSPKEMVFGR